MWTAKPLQSLNPNAVLMTGSHSSNTMTHYVTDRFQVRMNVSEYD
jgi:hypothetical protein